MPRKRRRSAKGPSLLDFIGSRSGATSAAGGGAGGATSRRAAKLELKNSSTSSGGARGSSGGRGREGSSSGSLEELLELLLVSPNGSGRSGSTTTAAEAAGSGEGGGEGRGGREDAGEVKLKLVEVEVRELGGLQLPRRPREARDGEEGYLLDVYYDGQRRRAVCKLLVGGEFVEVVDSTGHLPYFLTDVPPDKFWESPEGREIVKAKGFVRFEVVDKFDLLRWTPRKVTKIVVETPDVVTRLRDKVPRAWEANIKYHHNYIYDLQLVPGMRYAVVKGRLEPRGFEVSSEEEEKIRKIFEGEDETTIEMAVKWAPLFEEPPPKPHMLAVDIEVFTPFKGRVPNPTEASYPVISVAFTSTDGMKTIFVLARPGMKPVEKVPKEFPPDAVIEIFDSERALILEALKLISNYPVVVGFNSDNFDFPYLHNRALKLGVPRELIPFHFRRRRSGEIEAVKLTYGLHVDLYKFFSIKAIQTYAFGNAYKEFTLDAIASALLGMHKVEIEATVSDLSLAELVAYNVRDADLTLKLITFGNMLVWKLMILLMRISKLPLEDVTRSQVSAWIRSLFYWEHRRRGYLIPTREEIIKLKGGTRSEALIKGKKYQGAIVLDPPSGVFFDVVVLDFASLYPSIIKRWNLSYETVNPAKCPGGKLVEVPDVGHKVCMSVPGLTAQIVGLLRDYRVKLYKKKAKDKSLPEEERHWYDVVQSAMKVYINASYGVFGAENFPLYAPPLAESVTAIGRFTIKQTLQKAGELGLRVIYGDTDSLFLWAPDRSKLSELQEYVEEKFGLELEVDKEYKFVTFSGLKKNYIGVYPDGSVDIKGLLVKKRNTPEFLKKEFKEIIEVLSKVGSPEEFIVARNAIRDRLREVHRKLRNFEYNLDELAIRMAITKRLDEYKKTIPQHVRAALQLVREGIEVLPGDVVTFVKVRGREGVKPIQLAHLLEVDVDKYVDTVKSSFEQILAALNITWDEVVGASRLEAFFALSR